MAHANIRVATIPILASTAVMACAGRGPRYETPEDAAFASYRAAIDSATGARDTVVPVLYGNIPADSRQLEAPLQRDLSPWARTVRLFRDSSYCASAIIPLESLSAYREVYDVRALDPDRVLSHLRADRDTTPELLRFLARGRPYRVEHEWCRHWNCSRGAGAVVAGKGRSFRALGLYYTRIE